MNSFFDHIKIATEETCAAKWNGGKPGEFFYCALCGNKPKVGDGYIVLYTNDRQKAGGNPIVCTKCNSDVKDAKRKWVDLCEEFFDPKFKYLHAMWGIKL